MALAVICGGVRTIGDEIFLMAAEALADIVNEEDLNKGSLYPPLSTIQDCSVKIATRILEDAYKKGMF